MKALTYSLWMAWACWGLAGAAQPAQAAPASWWRGNLHTHSLWSDGDDYPEMIVRWYREQGYHFLALSDHNVLSQGTRWIEVTNNRGGSKALDRYEKTFGPAWVQRRKDDAGKDLVRLKPLAEFRHLFEVPGQFLLIQSEEISDAFEKRPVHLNATNLRDLIPPQHGSTMTEVLRRNVDAVLEQRKKTGQVMVPHLNHPNFGWAITAEDLLGVVNERFFEVYNGHPAVHNDGDHDHAGTERIWDILLSYRASAGEPLLYGLAVDDSHNYHGTSPKQSNPGRGWISVRSAWLTPEHIILSMERGDFYASSGVELSELEASAKHLRVLIREQPGITYRTQFIGTRRGFDPASEPVVNATGQPLAVTRRYSASIGQVLAEVTGVKAAYEFKGNELYVRAAVISSKKKVNGLAADEVERAWIQPVAPGR